MYHSAIGNIRAYTLTIQTTDDPVKVIIACNKIKEAAEEIIKAAEEKTEGGNKNGEDRSSDSRSQPTVN